MMRWLLRVTLCLPGAAVAAPWTFGEPITVTGSTDAPHYHHLDGTGRQHIAVSDTEVALVWEDNRSGAPQAYIAVKPRLASSFSDAFQLSDGEEAYEPVVTLIREGQWLAAWEQDGAVMARVIDGAKLRPVQLLADKGSRQVTLASNGAGCVAAFWVRQQGNGELIEGVELRLRQGGVDLADAPVAVARVEGHPSQGFPVAAWSPDGRLLVAWEDRRAGHTRLFHTWRERGGAFAQERQLNEHYSPTGSGSETVSLGSGAMRVMLASDGIDTVQVIWLDKRNPNSGYAVWGATSSDGGRTFGPNQRVQDELGDAVQQWHASLAGGKPGFVAAWDDAREGWDDADEPGDVLLSWRSGAGWSPDLVVPGASGAGYQGSPAIALDPHGDLHLIWIERDELASPSRLRYLLGVLD